ncbi:SDR family NAD(P)-dependent oxidoreductase [Mesorhizobium australicum]|uniref:NAD(P)-dependent dehydrogenase, short-chain alcohol dehydrogenase family n=1 Tax=Mesorhizobium australicum TaxID=536018 RepID=A0A1X7N376_9HYPH|nr:SDR family oxidoreductase [Mesorhizobium australicum]SMH30924.1 NAD(P)-dependent dehydrogenase, short-chain alcohol dehydrogenase family [Mesorhizobium australicum]
MADPADRDPDSVPDYMALARLGGQGHVVIGAGRGIGRQCAHALSQAGARVVCVDMDLSRAKTVAAELNGVAMSADVTKRAEVERLIDQARRELGRIDGIVNIVGASLGSTVLDATDELIDRNLDINLRHAILTVQVGARLMAENGGGCVTLVGSIAGISALPKQALYGAAKAALHHFVRSSAAELGHLGVRVNAVAPGYVRTPRMLDRFDDDKWDEIEDATPLQRSGVPSDIASVALFLASGWGSFLTGQVILADGGLTAPIRAMRASSAAQISGRLLNT